MDDNFSIRVGRNTFGGLGITILVPHSAGCFDFVGGYSLALRTPCQHCG